MAAQDAPDLVGCGVVPLSSFGGEGQRSLLTAGQLKAE
jgi:hypothetical protein